MSDWINEKNAENAQGSVAAAVAAAAAEVSAISDYSYVPALDAYFDKESGYFFKKGRHDFHHGTTRYTYHFDESSSSWQCAYEPDWDHVVGCPTNLDAYVLLSDLLDRIEIDEIAEDTGSCSIEEGVEREERTSSVDEVLPCIRAIVLESEELPYGHLSIITVDGAAIVCNEGGEDDIGGLVIAQENSEKALCRIRFDGKTKRFQLEKVLTEGGDEEGELVENSAILVKLNDSVMEKEIVDIAHQDRLTVDCGDASFIVLSLHIHKAMNTCAGCEPGLLLSNWNNVNETASYDSSSSKSKGELERERRRELKRIKKKYSLSRVDYVQQGQGQSQNRSKAKDAADSYTDRADIRRRTVGSDLPQSVAEAVAAKSAASSEKPMDEGNRGFQMLKKMGWKQGGGVGKREDGIQEPVCPVGHMDSSGLGASTSIRVAVGDMNQAQKRFKWSKAAQRYAKLETRSAFDAAVDDDEK